ncbi:DUF1501 domain-containing protein [Zavarzinella formosa]|uniref:DUF1501 domain-containing protein n=1 Tax=Zavarzinella formosa TaxID=360055 RepID=UPI00030D7221|nr:DUF1501 domain-containing protein [Zavarzinella formosa]
MLNSIPVWHDRRRFLSDSATGLGGIALAWMLNQERAAGAEAKPKPHFPAKAKRVIHVFSPGGVSHVDTFNHRPELDKADGKKLEGKGELDTFFGFPGVLRKSFYKFRQHGQCGAWVSELFPHLSKCVDDIAFLHAMVTKSPSHQPACFQMQSGFTLAGFPCLGAWLSYGLGRENDNLPTYVVLPDPRGLVNGGTANWSNGFLPAEHQGTLFNMSLPEPVSHLVTPATVKPEARLAGLKLVNDLNTDYAVQDPLDTSLSARVRSYELAAKMQASIPEAMNMENETAKTKQMYGLEDPVVGPTARNFLLARRLIERGVRFVQIYNGGALGSPRINWDAHENLRDNHDRQGQLLDQPCAALLQDLKQRGLLKDTLVIWSSEFGRTPFTQGANGLGRDHHQHCFTSWMAGAGVKPGIRYGSSDELGYKPGEHPTTVYDFHATILHLLGLDHERLTFPHNGIQRRLTDVHGNVIRAVLA